MIQDLSNKGCTDTEALEIATKLLQIELLEDHLGHSVEKEKLKLAIKALKQPQSRQLLDLLGDLSERERQCYLLHYVEQHSFNEIAKELGIKKGSVQSYISRARVKTQNSTM